MNADARPLARFAHAPLLLLITAFLMLQPLSTDIYLASLPRLASAFEVPAATVQLTLSLFVIGTVVGATHNGTLHPLTIIACALGLAIFGAVRMVPSTLARTPG